MNFSLLFIALAVFSLNSFAQKSDEILATATGHVVKTANISLEVQRAIADLPGSIARQRTDLLEQLIYQRLLEIEAAARNISVGQLIVKEKKKVADPSEADIKAVTEANASALSTKTKDQSRRTVIAFLRGEPERKAIEAMYLALRTKFRVSMGKDVNVANLAQTEMIASINGKVVTLKEFDEFARIPIYELRAELADLVLENVSATLAAMLVDNEAKDQGIDTSAIMAKEITDKMKDFSDGERESLEEAFQKKLFAKYNAKIIYQVPEPVAQVISVDDDPAIGPATGTVTVVMFTDFQCSACSATHPLLKKALADYSGKIRFVVRDYPLESIHENSFRAALAANAANLQGKFFEYTEILYKNQDSLDDASLKKFAAELGLNAAKFETDLNAFQTAGEVRKDIADGNTYGINSTPTIFINGIKVRDLSTAGFQAIIDRVLKK